MVRRRAVLATVVALSVCIAAATAGSASVSAGSSAKQGDPIKVMTTGPFVTPTSATNTPELPGAVQARFKVINKAGGVLDANGVRHKVEVIVCADHNDVNAAAQCGRDAVAKGVVAVTGSGGTQGYIAPLAAAGIPVISPLAGVPELVTSPNSFPLGNVIGSFNALAQTLARAGAKKVSLIYPNDLPGISALVPRAFSTGAGIAKIETGAVVGVARDVTDFGPSVAAAATLGVDGIVALGLGNNQGNLIRAIRASGFKGKIATAGFFITPELLKTLGKDANGLLLALVYPAVGTKGLPGMELFKRDMAAYDKKLPLTDAAVSFWLGARVFEQVVKTLPSIDRQSVLTAMGSLTNFDTGGLTPPLTTTAPAPGQPLPRIFNAAVTLGQVKGKKVLPLVDSFLNPTTGEVTPFVNQKK